MKLIDADALKEKLNEVFETVEVVTFNDIIAIIDNATTIEYPFYQEAFQSGYEEGKNERPNSV